MALFSKKKSFIQVLVLATLVISPSLIFIGASSSGGSGSSSTSHELTSDSDSSSSTAVIAVGTPEETASGIEHSLEAFERDHNDDSFSFEVTEFQFSESVICRVMDYEEQCEAATDLKQPHQVDFGMVTSTLFTEYQIDEYHDLQLYPAFAVGVVPIYNIPELGDKSTSNDLILTPKVLAKVFQSQISKWNDPEILALNPAINSSLPNATINVCVREDSSGVTEIFKKFLADADSDFAQSVGVSQNASWGQLGADYRTGKKGVMAYVTVTEYSISYINYEREMLYQSPNVRIQTEEGRVVEVSHEHIQQAVYDLGTHFAGDEDPSMHDSNFFTASLHSSDALASWPIVGYSYFALRRELYHYNANCELTERVLQFFDWFYAAKSTQTLLGFLGYGTFPQLHVEDIEEHMWDSFYCHGEHVSASYHRSLTVAGPASFEGAFDWFEAVFAGQYGDEEIVDIHYDTTFGEGEGAGSVYQAYIDGTANIIVAHRFGNDDHDMSDVVQIPFFAAQHSIIVNLCGEDHTTAAACNQSSMVLDAEAIGGIFDGSITHWNDDHLVALNPWLEEYSHEIQPILNEESEETTQVFVEHMESLLGEDWHLNTDFATDNNMHHVEAFVYGTQYSIGVTFLNPDIENVDHILFAHFLDDDGVESYPTMGSTLTECVKDGFDYSEHRMYFQHTEGLLDCHYPFIATYYLFTHKTYSEGSSSGGCEYVPLVAAQFMDFLLHDDAKGNLAHHNLLPYMPHVDDMYEWSQMQVDGISCESESLLLGHVEHNYQAPAMKIASSILASLSSTFCVSALIWTFRNRKLRIVRFSQPLFLYIMLVGTMIYSLCLVFITLDEYYFPAQVDEFGRETYPLLDSTCKVLPWLYTTGFTLVFGALLGKTWRIKEIFINPELKKKTIKNQTVAMQIGIGLAAVWFICLMWNFLDPLHWQKVIDELDPINGVSAVHWHGRCGSNSLEVFLPLIVALQLACFVYGTVLSYMIRSLKDDFSETTSINLAMFTNMQALLFVVLLGWIEQDNPTLLLIVITFFVLLGGFGTTALIVVPKIWIIQSQKRIMAKGEKVKKSQDALASHTSSSQGAARTDTAFPQSYNYSSSMNTGRTTNYMGAASKGAASRQSSRTRSAPVSPDPDTVQNSTPVFSEEEKTPHDGNQAGSGNKVAVLLAAGRCNPNIYNGNDNISSKLPQQGDCTNENKKPAQGKSGAYHHTWQQKKNKEDQVSKPQGVVHKDTLPVTRERDGSASNAPLLLVSQHGERRKKNILPPLV